MFQRSYAAQAATKAAPAAEGLQVSKLPSGTVVASLENNSPISRVGVFLRYDLFRLYYILEGQIVIINTLFTFSCWLYLLDLNTKFNKKKSLIK